MRDSICLALIKLARKFTSYGFTDDYLKEAEYCQKAWMKSYE